MVDLLTAGFSYSRRSWVRAFRRLSTHIPPPGCPKYGYLLEADGVPVGVIPMIFSAVMVDGEATVRCSVSSWYVRPAFRSYAALLASQGLKRKDVTYFVITPFRHTRPILEAQGYKRYCRGRFIALPALSPALPGCRTETIGPETPADDDIRPDEIELMRVHAAYGCLSVICHSDGRRYPFVFATRRKFGIVPFATLVYSRQLDDMVRFAGALGRFLARRGFAVLVVDANGPIAGLIGRYADGYPKYFRGPHQPRLGDLAYSKRIFFGV
ncbi:MAG: acyl-CoA acyltransferase [Alphaproteobacteria bacterium]|nr:acyl-CoA acyltransferase [Alphaproteobacteria bacterium]